ncbi:MAG TPA: hypothetical protein VGS19_19420, partial [Streptosporangiaceae bacterium]|nr:hypothetical protein [Streptosporangiaceae bacterium]
MIIFDTNQLESAQPPDGLLIAMLRMLGRETDHRLWLPELVLEEHLAHYRRGVEAAESNRQTTESELRRLIPYLRHQERPPLDVDDAVRDRTRRLKDAASGRRLPHRQQPHVGAGTARPDMT